MKHSEKMEKMGRLLAEWNIVNVGDQEEVHKKARTACYEITKLFPRIFIREWNRLLAERKQQRKEELKI
jgi:hypothetical protein